VTRLTVTVITHNEGHHVAGALESVAWADEIVVVDSGSSDDTVAIAGRYATRVVQHQWTGYGTQKNYAADLASHDWILSIDADERVAPALADEIRGLLKREPTAAGYEISRVAHYLGRWIRSTDWYPDFHVRLYDRRTARWSEDAVHESIQCPGRVERLRGELQHFPYRDVSEHLAKIDRYTTLIARQWAADGRRTAAWEAIVYPRLAFLRNFILRRGFLDGHTGLVVSMLNSYYVLLKYVKLFEMQQTGSAAPAPSAPDAGPAPGAGPAAG
jgi:glycosyltransferase involved in cell wall biosynthesis